MEGENGSTEAPAEARVRANRGLDGGLAGGDEGPQIRSRLSLVDKVDRTDRLIAYGGGRKGTIKDDALV